MGRGGAWEVSEKRRCWCRVCVGQGDQTQSSITRRHRDKDPHNSQTQPLRYLTGGAQHNPAPVQQMTIVNACGSAVANGAMNPTPRISAFELREAKRIYHLCDQRTIVDSSMATAASLQLINRGNRNLVWPTGMGGSWWASAPKVGICCVYLQRAAVRSKEVLGGSSSQLVQGSESQRNALLRVVAKGESHYDGIVDGIECCSPSPQHVVWWCF